MNEYSKIFKKHFEVCEGHFTSLKEVEHAVRGLSNSELYQFKRYLKVRFKWSREAQTNLVSGCVEFGEWGYKGFNKISG